MTISAHDFSNNNFLNFSEDNFLELTYTSLSFSDFTVEEMPEALKESTCLICKVDEKALKIKGLILYIRESGPGNVVTFKRKKIKPYSLLKITRNQNDNTSILFPYALGERIGSYMWEITLVAPQTFTDDFKEDVVITSLDDSQLDHYYFKGVDVIDDNNIPKKFTYRSKTK